jgi:hypothetical protein
MILAMGITMDSSVATIVVAIIVAVSSSYQARLLNKVHTLVNSNFHEAKDARLAAEEQLKISNELNIALQQKLDALQKKLDEQVKS